MHTAGRWDDNTQARIASKGPASQRSRFGLVFRIAAVGLLLLPGPLRAEPVSFRNDVMAVLSKAGCNQGACHGNQNGKGGFRLSLRGEDPARDYATLTRDMLGRRTNPLRPAESLVLRKATATIPHEGGRRFAPDSPEYAILSQWIGAGLPADSVGTLRLERLDVTPAEHALIEPADRVQIRARATFSDGSARDVTRLAVYEPSNAVASVSADGEAVRQRMGETAILVRYLDRQAVVQLAFVPARPDFAWEPVPEANFIDHQVFAKLRALRMLPSALCSDGVFMRRSYLDTLGVLPTADEARAFLADTCPDKRARLIDVLLERPEFADFWALKWSDLLRSEEKLLDPKGVRVFHEWIRQSILDHEPLNVFARDLIGARGSTYEEPAANFYRALRDPQARAEVVAQVFLGVRLQCARCHNHPFDRWTQDDYHCLAAFFARVDYRIVENRRRDKFDKHEFDGEQVVVMVREGEWKHPRTGAAMRPRFLGTPGPELAPAADRLQALADWVASPDNPLFARTQVNRVWYHLFGRGIVDPDDDFRASNPPVNGPLLDALTADFVAHHFDLRHLVRTILLSRTYQLSAVPNDTNRDDETNFSHAQVRPLQAEQLLDAMSQVTGVPVQFAGEPLGVRAGQMPGMRALRDREQGAGERFLKSFGKPDRLLSCDCERSDDATLGQALQLITGQTLNDMLSNRDNRIGKLLTAGRSEQEIIDEFYLAALSRPPTARELAAADALVRRAKDRRAALEDLVWGLVNAKEFLLRQ
jgi:hypothetical protein